MENQFEKTHFDGYIIGVAFRLFQEWHSYHKSKET